MNKKNLPFFQRKRKKRKRRKRRRKRKLFQINAKKTPVIIKKDFQSTIRKPIRIRIIRKQKSQKLPMILKVNKKWSPSLGIKKHQTHNEQVYNLYKDQQFLSINHLRIIINQTVLNIMQNMNTVKPTPITKIRVQSLIQTFNKYIIEGYEPTQSEIKIINEQVKVIHQGNSENMKVTHPNDKRKINLDKKKLKQLMRLGIQLIDRNNREVYKL